MKQRYEKQPIQERPQFGRKTRKCLMCRKPFASEWEGERVCRKCKSTETWRRG